MINNAHLQALRSICSSVPSQCSSLEMRELINRIASGLSISADDSYRLRSWADRTAGIWADIACAALLVEFSMQEPDGVDPVYVSRVLAVAQEAAS